jgi:hypothetical protein
MELSMCILEVSWAYVGIDLRGGKIRVAEQGLE